MKYFKPLTVFVIGFLILVFSQSFQQLSLINFATQMVLFGLVVCWPIWKTGRMSYVDIGWPWGLFCIGVISLLLGEGDPWRVKIVGGIYIIIGMDGDGCLTTMAKGLSEERVPSLSVSA